MYLRLISIGLTCVVVSLAAPQFEQSATPTFVIETTSTPIPIISQTESFSPDGSFNFTFETANGIQQQTSGFHKTIFVPLLRSDGTASEESEVRDIIAQTGSFSYRAPDGRIISLSFIADENGFQPIGEHLPTVSPLPPQVYDQQRVQLQQQQQRQLQQQQYDEAQAFELQQQQLQLQEQQQQQLQQNEEQLQQFGSVPLFGRAFTKNIQG